MSKNDIQYLSDLIICQMLFKHFAPSSVRSRQALLAVPFPEKGLASTAHRQQSQELNPEGPPLQALHTYTTETLSFLPLPWYYWIGLPCGDL